MGDLQSVKPGQTHLWKIVLATGVFLLCFVQLEGGKNSLWSIVSGTADTPSIQVLKLEGGEESNDGDRSLKETCDLYQGTWVKGEPLYSGAQCSILAPQWACRKSKRDDFGYENWRWRPTACDLPTFDADNFLERLRNKAVVFIGDSLGQQQFQSLLCLLSKGNMEKNVKEVTAKFGFRPPKFGPQRPPGWAYLFESTNTTVVLKANAFLGDIVPYNASYPSLGGHLDLGRPDTWIMRNFGWIDILVLNTGHHWGWGNLRGTHLIPLESGKELNSSTASIDDMHRRVLGRTMRYLNLAAEKRQPKPLVFFRARSPRHFLDGEWDSGGHCDNIKSQFGMDDIARRETIDTMAEDALRGMKNIRLLNITYLSQFRGEAHLSVWWLNYDAKSNVQDCLHWCLPGVPDTWNEILYANVILNDRKQKELNAENGN